MNALGKSLFFFWAKVKIFDCFQFFKIPCFILVKHLGKFWQLCSAKEHEYNHHVLYLLLGGSFKQGMKEVNWRSLIYQEYLIKLNI